MPQVKSEPFWMLYECNKGNRWSSTADNNQDGAFCNFSGCNPHEHHTHLVSATQDRAEAGNWFRHLYRNVPTLSGEIVHIAPYGAKKGTQ